MPVFTLNAKMNIVEFANTVDPDEVAHDDLDLRCLHLVF